MKHAIALILTVLFACGALSACVAGNEAKPDPTAAPTAAPQEESSEPLQAETLPLPTSPILPDPQVPMETIGEKPEADYSLPPENPGVDPVTE